MAIGDRIWIPRSKTDEPLFDCLICGRTLYHNQYERHVAKCSEEHAEELDDLRNHVAKGLPGPVDPELEDWVEENRKALLEDRLKM